MKDVRTVQDSFFKKNSHNHFNSANDDRDKNRYNNHTYFNEKNQYINHTWLNSGRSTRRNSEVPLHTTEAARFVLWSKANSPNISPGCSSPIL